MGSRSTPLGNALIALLVMLGVGMGVVDSVRRALGYHVDPSTPRARDDAMPPFTAVRHADGSTVSSASLRGKVVVLEFWGTWCPGCQLQAPRTQNLARRYTGADVVVLALDVAADRGTEPKESVARFLDTNHLPDYPVAYPAGNLAHDLGVNIFPTILIIGKDGNIRYKNEGHTDEDVLVEEIDRALSR